MHRCGAAHRMLDFAQADGAPAV